MTAIYKLTPDIDNYMMFVLDDMDIYEKMEDFSIDELGQPLSFKWVAPSGDFIPSDTDSTVLPDITMWSTNDLIVSQSSFTVLERALTPDVIEIYPITGKGSDYVFVNPIRRLDNNVIDLNKTVMSYFDDGAFDRIEKLAFNKSIANELASVFTLSIEGGVHLYCREEFKVLIDNHQIKGILFELLGDF